MMESRLRISIPWDCFQFLNRTENSITFTVTTVIHKSRKSTALWISRSWCDRVVKVRVLNLVGSTRVGSNPVADTTNHKPAAKSAVHPFEFGK